MDRVALRTTVDVVKRLREAGCVQVLLPVVHGRPFARLNILTSAPAARDVLADFEGWKRADVSEEVEAIQDALEAIAHAIPEEAFVASRSEIDYESDPELADAVEENWEERVEKAVARKAAEARELYAVVRESFDVEDLQRRLWLKTSTLGHTAAGVQWNVSLRTDGESRPPGGRPVKVASLFIRSAPATAPLGLPATESQPPIEMDLEDIDALLASLNALRDVMAQAGES